MFTILTGDHFMMYVSQITALYTLNLYSAVCQLYLSKTCKKEKDLGIRGAGGIRSLSLKKKISGRLRQVVPRPHFKKHWREPLRLQIAAIIFYQQRRDLDAPQWNVQLERGFFN